MWKKENTVRATTASRMTFMRFKCTQHAAMRSNWDGSFSRMDKNIFHMVHGACISLDDMCLRNENARKINFARNPGWRQVT